MNLTKRLLLAGGILGLGGGLLYVTNNNSDDEKETKKTEKSEETPKEVEKPKEVVTEVPKVEVPKVEVPKEVPKVEVEKPKAETPKKVPKAETPKKEVVVEKAKRGRPKKNDFKLFDPTTDIDSLSMSEYDSEDLDTVVSDSDVSDILSDDEKDTKTKKNRNKTKN